MKKYNLKKWKNIIRIGVMVMSIPFLVGCRKPAEKPNNKGDKWLTEMEQALYDKYEIHFQIDEVEEVAGSHAFSGTSYYAQVKQEDNDTYFKAFLSKDKKSLRDDYPRLVYDEMIAQTVEEILENQEGITDCSYKTMYALDEHAWKTEDELTDYLENSDTYIDISVEIDNENAEQAAEYAYQLSEKLQSEGMHFTINCLYHGNVIYIVYDKNTPLMSYEEIKQKFSEEVN